MPQAVKHAADSARSQRTRSPAGCSVGPWQLCRLVGEGEFTRVYSARLGQLANIAPGHAVKLLRAEKSGGRSLLDREARAAAAVSHPNLVAVFAAQLQVEPAYLVMPLLSGATLADRLAQGQRFSLSAGLAMLRQVASALAALATKGYRHGDVKPGNVMVSPTGHATLLDLGFACQRDEEPELDSRQWLGTPQYAAPERFTSRGGVDPQSDVYSLGITVYRLFAGRTPFEATALADLAAQHVHGAIPDLGVERPDLPRELIALSRRLLSKDPLRRPTPAELVEQLVRMEIDRFVDRGGALRA
jgi:serine/threonine protein kinase